MVYFITNNYILLTPFRVLFRYHKDSRREEIEGKKTDLHLTSIYIYIFSSCMHLLSFCVYSIFIVCMFCSPVGASILQVLSGWNLPGQIASWLYIRSAKTLQGIRSKALVSATIFIFIFSLLGVFCFGSI